MGFIILGLFLMATFKEKSRDTDNTNYRYELFSANENTIIIFDKQSGEYWTKFIPSNEGPTNWEKGDSPITNDDK